MSNGKQEPAWFKSTYSGSQGDDCVEIAITERAVHIRDSKDTGLPAFTVDGPSWEQFVRFASKR